MPRLIVWQHYPAQSASMIGGCPVVTWPLIFLPVLLTPCPSSTDFFCLHKKSWNPLLSTGWLAWMSRQVPGVTSHIKTAWSNSSWTPMLGTCGSGAAEGLPEPKAGSWEQVRRSRASSPCPSGAVEFQLVEDPFLLRLLITARKLVLSPFHCCSHCLFSLFSFNANFFLNAFLIYFYVFIV